MKRIFLILLPLFLLIGNVAYSLTIPNFTAGELDEAPNDSDLIPIWDASTSSTKYITAENLFIGIPTLDTDGDGIFSDESPQFTAINVGNSTDTTITRVSAGVIAIEGNTVLTTGNVTAANIEMDASPADDDTYKAIAVNGLNAGATIAQWEAVYFDATDSEYKLADNNGTGTWPAVGIAVAAGTDGNELKIVSHGAIRNDGWNWTGAIGQPIYLSDTAGGLTQTRPTSASSVAQQIGWVISADVIFVDVKPVDWGPIRSGTTAESKVLTCVEASSTIWTVTADDQDITLPDASTCPTISTSVSTKGAIDTDVDVNAENYMSMDGVDNTDGHKATSPTAAGECITCIYRDSDGVTCISTGWTAE